MIRTAAARLATAGLACCLLAVACSGGSTPEPEPVTLSFGHPFPAGHPLQKPVFEQWTADVSATTGGAVTIEIYPDEALSTAAETYQSVVEGSQDIGWGVHGYSPGLFPVTEVIEMPFVFNSGVEATNVLWQLHDEFAALRDQYSDVKLLGLFATSPAHLWLAHRSVTSLADLEGLTIRVPGTVQAKWLTALGAAPVEMAVPDVRDSLQSGEIDGVFTLKAALAVNGFDDLVASGTECNCFVLATYLVMNIDTWNSLPEDVQSAIDDLSGRELSHAGSATFDNAEAAAGPRNTEAGIATTRLQSAELDRWREAVSGVVDDWVAAHAGDFDARAMYDRMLELAAG